MTTEMGTLKGFPSEQFNAFSTTKMAKFLPYTAETTLDQLRQFFGNDFDSTVKYRAEQLIIYEKKNAIPVELNKIIVKFPNGSYKVIDGEYYHHNFNEPLL